MTRSNRPNQTSPLDILKQLTPSPDTGARVLCVLLVILTLMNSIVSEASSWLVIHQNTLPGGFITSIITNGFVAGRSGLFTVLLFIAIGVFFFRDLFRHWWHQYRVPLIVSIVGPLALLYGLDLVLGAKGIVWGLTIGVLFLLWFCIPVERKWGTKRLLIFCAIVSVVVNLVGASLLATWPSGLSAAISNNIAPLNGMSALNGALIAVWALMLGHQRLMILNIEAWALVWVLVIIGAFDFLLISRIKGLMDLTGLACAWLLVTGYWRPRYLLDRIRLGLLERRVERRRRGLHIVDSDDRTLH